MNFKCNQFNQGRGGQNFGYKNVLQQFVAGRGRGVPSSHQLNPKFNQNVPPDGYTCNRCSEKGHYI
jgi:hypothetical protein